MSDNRLFEDPIHANIYAKYRSIAPNNVIKIIIDYLGEKVSPNNWHIAVDVGCGSGQATNSLAQYFHRCYGLDVSAAQIKVATDSQHPINVVYEICSAENMSTIDTNSVQLVTAFQCVHWFDFEKFMRETTRVLVDNGVVALVGNLFGEAIDPNNPEDNSINGLLYDWRCDQRMPRFSDTKIKDNNYMDYKFDDNYEYKYLDNIRQPKIITSLDIIGRLESSSRYQELLARDPESAQMIIEDYKDRLKAILKIDNLLNKQITAYYTYFIALGRKLTN
ncbi:putative methyltransferase DDB_G0268948 [Oppia nitens]|uniref:putative methyltransferase DDB_G0268948 n=1 Tax=Oppia nitens TaxID=1686743 RepID=UPI0023DCA9F6|nr:putative methyltransferase DDB_G0268948 [Oppia nitens]